MPDIKSFLKTVAENDASDLHLCVGLPAKMRARGQLTSLQENALTHDEIVKMLLALDPQLATNLNLNKELDLAIELDGIARFRINIYYDRNGICAAFRLIPYQIKTLQELGMPEIVNSLSSMKRGLVLVTGITGSGKSTTLASIIDKINTERQCHIITIEEPIEFIYKNKKSIINQREVGKHTPSFVHALRAALREDPDVILLGEMRDLETISMAITAAETGHLVLTTLHTRGAAQSVDRIIDVFPAYQQEQIRAQLAEVLEMVISQVLVTSSDRTKRHLACEIMVVNSAIRHNIRDQKSYQIPSVIETGTKFGMQTLDYSLKELVNSGKISAPEAIPWLSNKKLFD